MDDMALEETLKLTFNLSHFVQGQRPTEAAATATTSAALSESLFIKYCSGGSGGGMMMLTSIDLYRTCS